MKRSVPAVLCLLVFLTISACAPAQPPAPTAPPTAASSATPTTTPTPPPTLTPTATLTPTPVPEIGKPLTGENWEITVLAAVSRDRIITGNSVFTPKKGYMLVDVGLKAKNLNPSVNPSARASLTFLIDAQKQAWPVIFWGDLPAVSGKEVDPFSVGIYADWKQGSLKADELKVEDESYLRFIFGLSDANLGQEVRFMFQDLPPVPFTVTK